MEMIKRTLEDVSQIPVMLQTFAKRSKNVFPPIAKDSMYRLLINKVTWVIIAILLLPCLLGVIIYYQTDEDRQIQNIEDPQKMRSLSTDRRLPTCLIFSRMSNNCLLYTSPSPRDS